MADAGGATYDDISKGKVDANLAVFASSKLSDGFSQGGVQAEVRRFQNHSRVGTPPQNGLCRAKPRKDASLIRRLEPRDGQIAACAKQTGCYRVLAPRLLNAGKLRCGIQPIEGLFGVCQDLRVVADVLEILSGIVLLVATSIDKIIC